MALERCASLEPDEHLATLVLRHVGDVRDRLALECVSGVWRAVGQIPGVWQREHLTLRGDLAARLTDARVCRVLRRAGPSLRSLIINDAPAAFTGEGLCCHAALLDEASGGVPGVAEGEGHGLPTPFARLQTLDLRGCPGVTGSTIVDLLRQLRIHQAPKVGQRS
jgi:hypothetical protein